jgi:flavin reductase (DIM6/NTAB) family NADH-FMN oxidoreductase RutF
MERTINLLPANAVTWLAAVRRTVRQRVLAFSGEKKGTPLPPSIPSQSDRLVEERFDKRNYRKALGQFATGVTVITTRAIDGGSVGLTANSFSSVSLDPPLVLWSLSRQSSSLADFIGASHFAIHVLAADQHYLSRRFSTSHPDRFSGVDYAQGTAGIPLLNGAIARFVCRNVRQYDAGDHVILIGEVEKYDLLEGNPLVFHSGEYRVVTRHAEFTES